MSSDEASDPSPAGDLSGVADLEERLGDLRTATMEWVGRFNEAIQVGASGLADLFLEESYWRDLVAAGPSLQTVVGGKNIAHELPERFGKAEITRLELEDGGPNAERLSGLGEVISATFRFRSGVGAGRGHVRLQASDVDGSLRALTFLTTLQTLDWDRLDGSRVGLEPVGGAESTEWRSRTVADVAGAEVLVVGGGQAGLAVAARLKELGIRAVIIEQNSRLGDNWRNRYDSLCLHNETCSSHLPYLSIPDDWPTYLSKDMIGDYLERYGQQMHLDVVPDAKVVHAEFRDTHWNVELSDAQGQTATAEPKFVVMATGVTGVVPKILNFPGTEDFQGDIIHSSQYTGSEDVAGRSVVVIGAGTSGHDIAHDLFLHGADATMVQRSSTTIVSLDSANIQYASYRELASGRSIEDIDLWAESVPNLLSLKLWVTITKEAAERDKLLLDGLERAGFAVDYGVGGAGLVSRIFQQYGGYYIDVGASQLIIDGKIKIKSGAGVDHLTKHGIVFTDGTTTNAEVIVLATGFEPMQEYIRDLFGDEVASRVGPVWGMDESGELMGVWRQTRQPRFYIMGGGLPHCRIYSRYVALQIALALRDDPSRRPASVDDYCTFG